MISLWPFCSPRRPVVSTTTRQLGSAAASTASRSRASPRGVAQSCAVAYHREAPALDAELRGERRAIVLETQIQCWELRARPDTVAGAWE